MNVSFSVVFAKRIIEIQSTGVSQLEIAVDNFDTLLTDRNIRMVTRNILTGVVMRVTEQGLDMPILSFKC